ncbi:phosphotransferase family protein [Kribbella sp. CWNU-51]
MVKAKSLPLDEISAEVTLREACAIARFDCADAELIRIGSNAIYRLRNGIIARVARSHQLEDIARREVAVSRWLAQHAVPAVRALSIEQPIITADRVVTFWESTSDETRFGTTSDLADLLRALHGLSTPVDLDLPAHDPFDRAKERLAVLEHLSLADQQFLLNRCQELSDAYVKLDYELPFGVIHGDANVGNVLVDDQGTAMLADLDGFAVGAREWDLILTAMFFERYGWHTSEEYDSFVSRYGYDVRGWSGYETLCDTREFLMVTWLARNAETDGHAAGELAKRVAALRTGASRRDWQPL